MRFSLEDCATVFTISPKGTMEAYDKMMNANNLSMTMNDTVTVVMVALGMVVLALLYLRGPPTVGMELEVIRKDRSHPVSAFARYLGRMTGRTETEYVGYTHSHVDNLKVVDDGSLNAGGVELVTPVMPVESRGLIKRICDALRGIVTTDGSCGVHVHLGLVPRDEFESGYGPQWGSDDPKWRDLNGWLGRILVAYGWFESAISECLSPSRRGGGGVHGGDRTLSLIHRINNCLSDMNYSLHALDKKANPTAVRRIYDALTGNGRYFKVNFTSIRKYGTVEFRQHQGSINPIHLNAWTDLLVALTTAARQPWMSGRSRDPCSYPKSLAGLWAWLGVNPQSDMAQVMERRKKRFEGELSVDESCDECGSSRCDRDDYCPTAAGRPYDNTAYMQAVEDERMGEVCGYCEEDEWGCECGSVSIVGMWMAMLAPFVLIVGCGIGAYHAVGRKFGMKKNLRSLKRLFTGLTSRGKAASGFALRTLSGCNPNTQKRIAGKPATWVLKDNVSAHILAPKLNTLLDPQTQMVLLHTRLPTDGANTMKNAHPHRDPQRVGITLVHNGMIWDHNKSFPEGVKPQTECDSEVIAAQLADGGIEAVVANLTGSMALLWHDDRESGVLNAWRNDGNPLHFSRLDSKAGPVVFGSTEKHLKDAYKNRLVKVHSCVEGRHYKVHPDGTITHEDIAGSEYTYYTRYVRWSVKDDISGTDDWTDVQDDFGLVDYYRKRDEKKRGKHTYDSSNHQGVRPDGTTYDLPHNVDPLMDQLDMIDLENGEWDPENYKASNLYGDFSWV